MKSRVRKALAAALVGGLGLIPATRAGLTNAVPWSESFESYTNGSAVAGTNGWTAGAPDAATVRTDPALTALLTNYPTDGRSYPLASASHTNVLQLASEVQNAVGGVTGGVVKVDFLVLPTLMETPPTGDTNVQCSFCVSTNGRLTVWHHNATLATNEWRELTNSPAIGTNAWARFTIVSDYSNGLFQVSVNEGAPIGDSAGWSAAGGASGGAWYGMVMAGRKLSGFKADGESAYLDDVLVTNRTLTWSGSGFTETNLNNGRLDTNVPFMVTLAADTFSGLAGEDLAASGAVVASGVPAGLTAVVTRASATEAVVTFAGAAVRHEGTDSVATVGLRFTDAAFGYGSAWDVAGRERTGLTVTFLDTPRLAWSTNAYWEAAANDGSLDNSVPLLVDLANGTFAGTPGEDFGTNAAKVTFLNLPAGLTAEAVLLGATQVRLRLQGNAAAHAAADSLANVGVEFQDGAFVTVPASSVFHGSTNLTVTFTDAGVLTYGAVVFGETTANNGAVSGTTLSLANRTFNGTNGEDLVAAGKVGGANVPAGLTLEVVVTDSGHATLALGGRAASHAAAHSIGNLGVLFADGAFTGGNAAGVVNGARTDLAVAFDDQPVVSAAAVTFAEAAANNGTIGNALSVALAGQSFSATGFTAGVQYTVANVPAGLSFSLALADATHVTAALTGTAASHTAADGVANLRLTFLDAAFTTVAAADTVGHPLDFAVTFADAPVVTWGGGPFMELAGGAIDNRSPVTVTVTGDTFGGVEGQDFVAAGWLVVANLPAGLTARATRDSAAQLSLTLTGRAANHAASNSVTNVTATFQDGAFAAAAAAQVTDYRKTDLGVTFVDDTGFFNTVPYEEPFEGYANNTLLDGTNGWQALDVADAARVTNDAAVAASLALYLQTHAQFPVGGDHALALSVQDSIQDAIHSETARTVYVDFMAWPVPLQAPPEADTNVQCAFYVSTNSQLVIWHNNRAGGPAANEWIVLTNAPLIDTSRWMRLTIAQDYASHLFQVRVNESLPVADARGWTDGGAAPGGPWYHMVRTNGTLTGFRMSGVGDGYLDDLTVRTTPPTDLGWRGGAVFKLR